MPPVRTERYPVTSEPDVVSVRQVTRSWAKDLGFGLVDQTKIVTAASELARNTLVHGGGGWVDIMALREGARIGLRLAFEDRGPGIPNIELALKDGYSTGSGLGLGLGGSKRLMDDFEVLSQPGDGTRVVITRWK